MARAHVIVIGNEKGGSGKSTLSMHLAVLLLRAGASVGTIDLDSRQASLTRYFENRNRYGGDMPSPEHAAPPLDIPAAEFEQLVTGMVSRHHAVIIDTPGADTPLSRLGHALADTLITPLNDSLIDFDVLARVDSLNRIERPSHYSEMVWSCRQMRAQRGLAAVDWIVLRNRLSHVDSRNSRKMDELLQSLAKRVRFRVAPGLSERVIYRELFQLGLTLLDIREPTAGMTATLSHVAARQELRAFLDALNLPFNTEF
jgi:chromosome partitioning protein